MRCDRAQALMDRYAAEELLPDEREALSLHVRDCPACQQQLARLQKLLRTLRSVPSPPVPQGFVGRVMARAQQKIDSQRPLVDGGPRLASWWRLVVAPHLVKVAAAIAAGLLVGLVLGRQTWQHSVSTSATARPAANVKAVDAETVYSLDYLSGTPRGSFAETYLSLTSAGTDQEF